MRSLQLHGDRDLRLEEIERLAAIFENKVWHQRWEIAPGIFTPGGNDVAQIMDLAGVPASLTGKRVLDIGAWNGCCSFECERRGAAEVIAYGTAVRFV